MINFIHLQQLFNKNAETLSEYLLRL